MMTRHRHFLPALLALFLLAGFSITQLFTAPALSATALPVDNSQITYDTFGTRLDAHDGDLLQTADGTIYLYGTSYACGFQLNVESAYCGVKVYKSTDLQTWTPAGGVGGSYAFDHLDQEWQDLCAPPDHFGCYRPHVVQRPSDGKFVMWLNTHGDNGYKILVSDTPGGPFVDTGIVPTLGVQPPMGGLRYGDEDITISKAGVGYVSYTAIWPADNRHDIVVEMLDDTLTTGTGQYVILDAQPGVGELVEAPGLFQSPGGTWHMVYSDPAKPYLVTSTGIMNAPTPMGPWTMPRTLVWNSCSGQPSGVWPLVNATGTTRWVYGSDRWVGGQANQTRANNYYGALTFNANGGTAIDAYTCQGSWTF